MSMKHTDLKYTKNFMIPRAEPFWFMEITFHLISFYKVMDQCDIHPHLTEKLFRADKQMDEMNGFKDRKIILICMLINIHISYISHFHSCKIVNDILKKGTCLCLFFSKEIYANGC